MTQFAAFFAELHDKGILFRSIHLNNIIVPDSVGALGLIDIADMKVFNKGLSFSQRMRNLRHLTRYKDDRHSIKVFGVERFVDIYFSAGKLAELAQERLSCEDAIDNRCGRQHLICPLVNSFLIL